MSSLDELCAMLADRHEEFFVNDFGVNWRYYSDPHTATESMDGTLIVTGLTPEQVIAATLGAETCRLEEIDKDCDTASEYMINREWCFDAVYRCSCGCRFGHAAHDRPRYCPNCGRRCVG